MSLLETERQAVAPKRIGPALAQIWRNCCAGEPGETEVSRALTLNLVAVADAGEEAALRESLRPMVGRLPCRAFVVTLHPERTEIAAAVRGLARTAGRNRHLVLEQVDLEVPPGQTDRLAGLVRPLLVNDIPTHLYWATDWPGDPASFDDLAAMADHVVVDSSRQQDPDAMLDELAQRRAGGLRVTDLCWLRTQPWRRALAEGFERARYDPATGTNVEIVRAAGAGAAGLLLQRWLADRLDAAVTVRAADEGTAAGADGICRVRIAHGATSIAAAASGDRIRVEVETAKLCFLPFEVPASRGRVVDLLAAAIDLA